MQDEGAATPLDPFDARGDGLDAGLFPLPLHVVQQRLLHPARLGILDAARRRHVRGIGEDRLGLGKICDSGEELRGFKQPVVEPRLRGLHRSRDARHAAADDRHVEHLGILSPVAAEIGLGENRADGLRARLRAELQQRHPRKIAHDAHAGDVGQTLLADQRKFFDRPSRPFAVEPVIVSGKDAHRFSGTYSAVV